MIRKKKAYVKPRKKFQISRIKEENKLLKEYGLKNKKEIWKTTALLSYYRGRAKALARASSEEQSVLFSKLKAIGISVNSIAEVLDLKTDDFLKRRLTTVLFKKGLALTPQQARQMVSHRRVLVSDRIVNIPSYLVSTDDESAISIKVKSIQQEQSTNQTQEASA